MTNVLIPTDFSAGSLLLVERTAQTISGDLNIFLFHAFDMPDSLVETLLRTGGNNYYNLITEELRFKCRQIKMSNSNIGNISFRIMYGDTKMAFKNFAEANGIDTIVLPADYFFIPVVRASVNPVHMMRKSGIPLVSTFNEQKILNKMLNAERQPKKLQGSSVAV